MDHKAFHAISYGIYVVSSKEHDRLNGQIANTVFQTASDPPMIAVCLNKENLTHEFVQKSKVFAVSVLSTETPMSFIGQFGFKSGRDSDKFAGIDHRFGVTGAPIVLSHGVAYLEAEVQGSLDSATHTLFVARVVAAEVLDADAEPMTYSHYHQVKGGRSPKTAPTYVSPAKEQAQRPETEGPVLAKWVCTVCGYIYDPGIGDPDGGIAPGTPFEEIPSDWVCPVCGVGKDEFEPAQE